MHHQGKGSDHNYCKIKNLQSPPNRIKNLQTRSGPKPNALNNLRKTPRGSGDEYKATSHPYQDPNSPGACGHR